MNYTQIGFDFGLGLAMAFLVIMAVLSLVNYVLFPVVRKVIAFFADKFQSWLK